MNSFEMPSPEGISRENEIPRATVVVAGSELAGFDAKGNLAKVVVPEIGLKSGDFIVVGDDKGRKIKAEVQGVGKGNLAEIKFVEEQQGI